jgi:hypothetical protein
MEQRAPKPTELEKAQDFPTPPWAGRAGAELVLSLDPGARVIREPACGEMHMAGPLQAFFPEVLPSDVHAHGPNTPIIDWLDDAAWPDKPDCDWVVTNPPFAIADQFVTRGLKRARRGVALLLRMAFCESAERHVLFEGVDNPLTLLAPFSERVAFDLGRWDPKASKATAFAWFIWDKEGQPMPPRWIKPGTKRRLTLPGDAAEYGWAPPLPLFEDAP